MIVNSVKQKQRTTTMSKYYIKCGTLEIIISSDKDPFDTAIDSIWELNDNDTLDEYFYVDERGFRDYISAEPDTQVFETVEILKKAGWSVD